MRDLGTEDLVHEQTRVVVRATMESMVRLLQRCLNHERLSDLELEHLANRCEWVWHWAANVERESDWWATKDAVDAGNGPPVR